MGLDSNGFSSYTSDRSCCIVGKTCRSNADIDQPGRIPTTPSQLEYFFGVGWNHHFLGFDVLVPGISIATAVQELVEKVHGRSFTVTVHGSLHGQPLLLNILVD